MEYAGMEDIVDLCRSSMTKSTFHLDREGCKVDSTITFMQLFWGESISHHPLIEFHF